MRKFTIICNFPQGQSGGYDFYIGAPDNENQPTHHQHKILSDKKNGNIHPKALETLKKVQKLANKLNINTGDLLIYLLGLEI